MKRWILGLVMASGLSLVSSSAFAHGPHHGGHHGCYPPPCHHHCAPRPSYSAYYGGYPMGYSSYYQPGFSFSYGSPRFSIGVGGW